MITKKVFIGPSYLRKTILDTYSQVASIKYYTKEDFITLFTFPSSLEDNFRYFSLYINMYNETEYKIDNYSFFLKVLNSAKYLKTSKKDRDKILPFKSSLPFEIDLAYKVRDLIDDYLNTKEGSLSSSILKDFISNNEITVLNYPLKDNSDLKYVLDNIVYKDKESKLYHEEIRESFKQDYPLEIKKFTTSEIEVSYCFNEIADLIFTTLNSQSGKDKKTSSSSSSISLSDIAIVTSSSYLSTINFINSFYHLPLSSESVKLIEIDNFLNYLKSTSYEDLESKLSEDRGKLDQSNNNESDKSFYDLLDQLIKFGKEDLNLPFHHSLDYLKLKLQQVNYTSYTEGIKVYTSLNSNSINKSYKYLYILGYNDMLEGKLGDNDFIYDILKEQTSCSFKMLTYKQKVCKENEIILFLNNIENLYITYSSFSPINQFNPYSTVSPDHKKVFKENSLFYLSDRNYDFIIEELPLYYSSEFLKYYGSHLYYLNKITNKDKSFASKIDKIPSLSINYNTYNSDFKMSKDGDDKNDGSTPLINTRGSYSASSLEDYTSCPFKFFLNRSKIFETDTNVVNIQVGNYYHKVFEEIINKTTTVNKDESISSLFTVDKSLKFLESKKVIFKTETERLQFLFKTLPHEYTSNYISKFLDRFFLDKEHTKKMYAERSYLTSFCSKVDNKTKLTLSGKVDAITFIDDKSFIFDFKTSKSQYNPDVLASKINSFIDTQLLIYAYFFNKDKDFSKDQKLHFVGPSYFQFIRSPLKKITSYVGVGLLNSKLEYTYSLEGVEKFNPLSSKLVVSQSQFDNLVDSVESKISDIDYKIRCNDFSITPYQLKDESPCKYCQYKDICFRRRKNFINKINIEDLGSVKEDETE